MRSVLALPEFFLPSWRADEKAPVERGFGDGGGRTKPAPAGETRAAAAAEREKRIFRLEAGGVMVVRR